MRGAGSHLLFGLCATTALASSVVFGCRRADDASKVAELVELRGSAVRDFAAHPNDWKPAAVDEHFSIGDAVRTAKDTTARIRLVRGGVLKLGGNTLLRFLLRGGQDQKQRIGIEMGLAEIESGDDPLLFDVGIGLLHIERGSMVQLATEGDRVRFRVLVGDAVLERDGGTVSMRPGDTFLVDIGGAIIEHVGREAPDAEPPRDFAPDSGEGSDLSFEHSPNGERRGPLLMPEIATSRRVDVTVEAGESAAVHDVQAPTAVRIRTGALCPGDARIEVMDGGRYKRAPLATSAAGSTVVMSVGSHRYRVLCIDGETVRASAAATGTLRIVKDSGAARLPRSAPRNVIEADGRRYRVLYQGLLPALTFRWPSAPASGKYMLYVQPSGGPVISAPAKLASHSFRSGALAEGPYQFWFEADDANHTRSPTTNLRIDFDNAAPAAEIQAPSARASGAVAVSGAVEVAGIALEGASVSVDGINLPLDLQQRFRAEVPVEGRSGLAIRIAHPARGIHYYVRRLGE